MVALQHRAGVDGAQQLQRLGTTHLIRSSRPDGQCRICPSADIVSMHGVAPVCPPRRCAATGGTVIEYVGDAPGVTATGKPGIADIARHHLERDARTILYVAQRHIGAIGPLRGQEHAGDTGDDDQTQQHGDHQFDQGEAGRQPAQARRRPCLAVRDNGMPAHRMALVITV